MEQINNTYKVVPFVGVINQKNRQITDVSKQLETLINEQINLGWTYVRLESVSSFVTPDDGCFGIGAKPGYNTVTQVVVFERTK
jgi:hypothetical protein